ncbi:hypothetical protein [Geodermatophilus marinus]|uniref:hypothetical protein n=1 Tax=Geodermatophilus sp. LHW52908 TaxID=2303986 RepID=UPI0018F5A929|nr:hypothetical protein [Geodermatophilus sp. LHW52908]
MTSTPSPRVAAGLLAGGLAVVGLSGCGGTAEDASSAVESAATAAESAGEAAQSAAESARSAAESAGSAAASAAEDAASSVDCSGTSCSVTLTGEGAQVDVLGNRIAFNGVQDGQASLTVGGTEATCTQGQSVAAGPLNLECSTVTADEVTLTASLG